MSFFKAPFREVKRAFRREKGFDDSKFLLSDYKKPLNDYKIFLNE